jgi:hypothetical protein
VLPLSLRESMNYIETRVVEGDRTTQILLGKQRILRYDKETNNTSCSTCHAPTSAALSSSAAKLSSYKIRSLCVIPKRIICLILVFDIEFQEPNFLLFNRPSISGSLRLFSHTLTSTFQNIYWITKAIRIY